MPTISYIEQLSRLEEFRDNRIMVVDDEEFCIASMKVVLGKAGIDVYSQVDFCITGLEAISQFKNAT